METIQKVINILDSKEMFDIMSQIYEIEKSNIKKQWKSKNRFIKYLKGFIVYQCETKAKGDVDALIACLINKNFNTGVVGILTDTLNASVSQVNEPMDTYVKEDLEKLIALKDDPLHEVLALKNDVFVKTILDRLKLKHISRLDGYKLYKYRFDQTDIKALENASKIPGLIRVAHSLYDDFDDEMVTLDYDSIDVPLKGLIPHGRGNNPEIDVILENGTILQYYDGNIRVWPFNFKELVFLTKLQFIDNYYHGEDNDRFQFFLEPYDEEFDMDMGSMDDETFELFVSIAAEMAGSIAQCLMDVYSKKMIDTSLEDVRNIKDTIYKYKLKGTK